MGMPQLITDPRFVDNTSRCDNDVALDDIIAAWFAERDCDDLMAQFDQAEVVAGPVLDIRDIVQDPHYIARQNIVSVQDDDFESVRMQNVVPRFSSTPGEVRHAGRALGADNTEVFTRLLGLTPSELDALVAEGII
jgi:crotonobetainyl-CoA:carnitine CoA-transferase CaiB-like acyl-CoA transferase